MNSCTRLFILLAAILLLAGGAQALENNWRISINPDDGDPANSGPTVTLGVAAFASSYPLVIPTEPQPVVGLISGTQLLRTRILGNTASYPRIWSLTVAGVPDYTGTIIRLNLGTWGGMVLPPETVLGGLSATYTLKMVNNRGVTGAPADGTKWSIPIPTTHSSTPFYSLTLPRLSVSMNGEMYFISEGYRMEFTQDAVPEPSSLAALGLALTGLLASRRRRT